MTRENILAHQRALNAAGFGRLKEDGAWGPMTASATERAVAAGRVRIVGADKAEDLPWMQIARSVLGLHESRDNAALRQWLRSDGATLGDPAILPWCGDFVETCIKLALPDERFPGPLGQNRYWARNWIYFGEPTQATYGAIAVFGRVGGGHVGFVVGDDETGNFAILGGNQSNAVTITRIAKNRLLEGGLRWPETWPPQPIRLPRVAASGPISINEA